jgi:hypothetical protein
MSSIIIIVELITILIIQILMVKTKSFSIFICMDIKVSEKKLDMLKDIIISGIGIEDTAREDLYNFFQPRTKGVEFLTPKTRKDVIAKYDNETNTIMVFDDEFFEIISRFVGSRNVYDLIKKDIIKRIFKSFTKNYKSIFPPEPNGVIFVNKKLK